MERSAVACSDSNSIEVTFFIPCFNESENICGAIDTVREIARGNDFSYEILVVDDGSTDNTKEKIEQYQSSHQDLPILFNRNPVNRGLGYNYFSAAERAKGKYFILINGDNDIPPSDFRQIIKARGHADMIIPYLQDDVRPLFRQFVSRLFTILVNVINGYRIHYYNGPVLHFRHNVVRFRSDSTGFAYQAELITHAIHEGCSYQEMPFHTTAEKDMFTTAFRSRNILSTLKSLIRLVKERFLG